MTLLHTDGPWEIDPNDPLRVIHLEPDCGDDGRAQLFAQPVCELADVALAEGNGRLIAAAPQMLDALHAARKLIIALMPGVGHIALQDYRELNETPLLIDRVINQIERGA